MIRVLHVDDSPDDRELNRYQLLRIAKDIEIVEAESVDEALAALKREQFDCVLSDYQMPVRDGLDLLTCLRESGNETPFIFLTGQGSEDVAAAALRAGADDYFTKEAGFAHYERLENSLKRVTDAHKARVNHRKAINDLEESEEKYRNLVVRANDLIVIVQDGLIKFANRQMEKLLGYEAFEAEDTPFLEYFHPDEVEKVKNLHKRRLSHYDVPQIYESVLVDKDDRRIEVEINAGLIDYQGRPAVLAFVRDITERKRSEQALRESEASLRTLIENAPDAIILIDVDTEEIILVNENALKLFKLDRETLIGMTPAELSGAPQPDGRTWEKDILPMRERLTSGESTLFEWVVRDAEGNEIPCEIRNVRLPVEGRNLIRTSIIDISERKRGEENLKTQLTRIQTQQETIVKLSTYESMQSNDFPRAAEAITETVAEALDVERIGIWLFSEDGSELHCEDLYERTKQRHSRGTILSVSDYPSYFAALASSRTIDAHDAIADPRTSEFAESYLRPLGITSMLDSPIRIGGEVAGVVCFEHVGKARHWQTDEIMFAGEVADQATHALLNSRGARIEVERDRLFNYSLDMLCVAGFDGYFKQVNPAWSRILGWSEEELLSKPWLEFTHPDDAEATIAAGEQLHAGKSVVSFVNRYRCKDGSYRWLAWNSYPLAEEGLIFAVARDITESRDSEETLKASEVKYRRLFETNIAGVFRSTLEGEILEFNPALCRLLGYEALEELRDINIESFYAHSEDRLKLTAILQTDGRVENFETELRKKNGETIWVLINAVLSDDGVIQGTLIDVTQKRYSEQEIQRSKTELDSILRAAPVGIGTVIDRVIKHANDTLCDMLGYSEEELRNADARMLYINGEEFERVGRVKYKMIAEHGTGTVETQWKCKDGSIIDILLSSTPLEVNDPSKGITFTALDITDQKLAETALQESERYYRTLIDVASDAIFILEGSTFVDCNLKTTEIFGCSKEQILGKTPLEFSTPTQYDGRESQKKASELVRAALRGESLRFEWRHCRMDGAPFDTEVSLKRIEGVDEPLLFAVVRDITERKRIEDALRESEQTYRALFEHASDAIFLLDLDGTLIDMNDQASALLGYSRDEMIGMHSLSVVQPDEKDESSNKIEGLREGQTYTAYERRFVKKSGEELTVEISPSMVLDRDNKPMYILSIVRDVTQRRAVEQTLRRSRNQLAAANRELETFSYSVSHDLRAPLRHIKGFVQLLSDDSENLSPEDRAKFTNNIVTSVERMEHLIEALLKLSRVTRVEFNRSQTSLSDIAGEIANRLKSQDADRSVEFVIGRNLMANADPDLARVVLENLFSNAWKFTRDREKAVIELGSRKIENGTVAYFVRDNGIGFDQAESEKLFTPFHRLPGAQGFEGTGVGLATVQRIVHRHGGRIWAEAESGKGATFYFTLG